MPKQYYRERNSKASKGEMDERFVAQCRLEYPELTINTDILYRRQHALRDGRMDGLPNKRGKARNGQALLPNKVVSAFFTIYLTQSKLSVPRCMKAVEEWAKEKMPDALPLPEYNTFYRKAMDLPVRVLCREGPKAYYDKCSPYTRRQYETLGANDWWVSDTNTCDAMTWAPDSTEHWP